MAAGFVESSDARDKIAKKTSDPNDSMHLNSQNKCWLEITPQQPANEQRLTLPSESQTTVLK